MTVRFNMPRAYSGDANGNPRSGATLEFYDPGTLTPKDVYSDSDLETPISQPVTASSAGLFPDIFMQAALYRVIHKTSAGVTVFDSDDLDPGLGAGFGVSSLVGIAQGGTSAGSAAAARSNLGAASSEALSDVQDNVTELQTQIAPGLNNDGVLGDLAALSSIARENLATSFGPVVVQAVDATPYATSEGLTTAIPQDDTIPTSSEGSEILTAAITPTSSSNKIRIQIDGFCFSSSSIVPIIALFRGTTCVNVYVGSVSTYSNIGSTFIDAPGTTGETTYSVRVGPPSGGGTIYMNGNNSGRQFGGKAVCTMRLEEIEVH